VQSWNASSAKWYYGQATASDGSPDTRKGYLNSWKTELINATAILWVNAYTTPTVGGGLRLRRKQIIQENGLKVDNREHVPCSNSSLSSTFSTGTDHRLWQATDAHQFDGADGGWRHIGSRQSFRKCGDVSWGGVGEKLIPVTDRLH